MNDETHCNCVNSNLPLGTIFKVAEFSTNLFFESVRKGQDNCFRLFDLLNFRTILLRRCDFEHVVTGYNALLLHVLN